MKKPRLPQRTIDLVHKKTNGYCEKCTKRGTEVHHKLSKSQMNIARFPLFIDSIQNLQFLCYDCHHNKPLDKIRENEAQVHEDWLKAFKDGSLC